VGYELLLDFIVTTGKYFSWYNKELPTYNNCKISSRANPLLVVLTGFGLSTGKITYRYSVHDAASNLCILLENWINVWQFWNLEN